jgi:cytidine deaminase
MTMTDKALFEQAKAAAARAYAPYSGFRVGAAALAASGQVYTGANMENASYGATICAERVALVQALYAGEREFTALAVYAEQTVGNGQPADGGDQPAPRPAVAWPCGICRQFLSEFGAATRVIVGTDAARLEVRTLAELLPDSFIL